MSFLKTYTQPFLEAADEIVQRTVETLRLRSPDFDWFEELEDGVFIKNRQGTIVQFNQEFVRVAKGGPGHIDRTGSVYMEKKLAEISKRSDELVFGGASSLDFVHQAFASDGRKYLFHTFKCDLASEKVSGYELLGITRPIAPLDEDSSKSDQELHQLHQRFVLLSLRDQDICRLTVLGATSREIGDRLGISSRAIEMRKQKIFETLKVAKSIELARKLVRMEERGILKLGLDE